jgi:hypothetical protein
VLEPDEVERRHSVRGLHKQIDIGVLSRIASGNRPENRQMPVPMVGGNHLQNRCRSINHNLWMNGAQLGGVPKLLTHRGLSDAERLGDLALGHPRGQHGPQSQNAPESDDLLVAPRASILSHQRHKMILSPRAGSPPASRKPTHDENRRARPRSVVRLVSKTLLATDPANLQCPLGDQGPTPSRCAATGSAPGADRLSQPHRVPRPGPGGSPPTDQTRAAW